MWIVDDAKHVSESSGILYFSLLRKFSFYLVRSHIRACTQSLIEWLRYNWIIQRWIRWQCEYRTSPYNVHRYDDAPTQLHSHLHFGTSAAPFSSFACIFYFTLYRIDHRVTLEWHLNASEYLRTCLASYQIATRRYIESETASGQNIPVSCLLTCNENRQKMNELFRDVIIYLLLLFSNSRKTYGYVEHGTRDTPKWWTTNCRATADAWNRPCSRL